MSLDAEASKSTWRGPAAWAHVNEALRARVVPVTGALALPASPKASVTVNVTVYSPSFVYSCVAIGPRLNAPSPHAMEYDAMPPSGSEDPDPSAVTSSNVRTEAGLTERTAVGGRLTTSMILLVEAGAPSPCVTVRVTVYVPGALYTLSKMCAPLPVEPSPQTQAYETITPSGSDDPEEAE